MDGSDFIASATREAKRDAVDVERILKLMRDHETRSLEVCLTTGDHVVTLLTRKIDAGLLVRGGSDQFLSTQFGRDAGHIRRFLRLHKYSHMLADAEAWLQSGSRKLDSP